MKRRETRACIHFLRRLATGLKIGLTANTPADKTHHYQPSHRPVWITQPLTRPDHTARRKEHQDSFLPGTNHSTYLEQRNISCTYTRLPSHTTCICRPWRPSASTTSPSSRKPTPRPLPPTTPPSSAACPTSSRSRSRSTKSRWTTTSP